MHNMAVWPTQLVLSTLRAGSQRVVARSLQPLPCVQRGRTATCPARVALQMSQRQQASKWLLTCLHSLCHCAAWAQLPLQHVLKAAGQQMMLERVFVLPYVAGPQLQFD